MSRLRLGFLLPLAFLLAGAPPHPAAAQERPLQGAWTGGFMLRGAWVAVNLRVAAPGDSAGDNADLLFPSYGGAENAINVPVEALNQTPNPRRRRAVSPGSIHSVLVEPCVNPLGGP